MKEKRFKWKISPFTTQITRASLIQLFCVRVKSFNLHPKWVYILSEKLRFYNLKFEDCNKYLAWLNTIMIIKKSDKFKFFQLFYFLFLFWLFFFFTFFSFKFFSNCYQIDKIGPIKSNFSGSVTLKNIMCGNKIIKDKLSRFVFCSTNHPHKHHPHNESA